MCSMDHKWIQCSNGEIPARAVYANDNSDGYAFYIGRAEYGGEILPVKIVPEICRAFVICKDGNNEIEVETYEALSGLHYEWLDLSSDDLINAAVKVGCDANGEFLYAARASWEGSLTPGTIDPINGYKLCWDEESYTGFEVLVQPDTWIDAKADSMPEGAIEGGRDADGDVTYVGRVFHDGDLLPAKVVPSKGGAFATWNSKEHRVENFQVLVGAGFVWTPCEHGNIPVGAIRADKMPDGPTLYVGRTQYAGSLCVGKVQSTDGVICFPYRGKELRVESFEVLTRI